MKTNKLIQLLPKEHDLLEYQAIFQYEELSLIMTHDLDLIKAKGVSYFDNKKFTELNLTPLMVAAYYNAIDTVEWLVNQGIDLNFEQQGYRSGQIAASSASFDVLKFLIDKGVGTTYLDSQANLFHRIVYNYENADATSAEVIEVINYMLDKGIQGIADKDDIGATTLLYACANSEFEGVQISLIKHLLDLGCTLNDTDNHGRNCLHYIARNTCYSRGNTHILINWLVQQGIDINTKDKENLTALEYSTGNDIVGGYLCMYPQIEINLQNLKLKKKLISDLSEQNVFKFFDEAFEDYYGSDNPPTLHVFIASLNVLRAFNKLKDGDDEDKEFIQKLSERLLTQINGVLQYSNKQVLEPLLNASKEINPQYAEIILHLIIYNELNYSDLYLFESLKLEFKNILPKVINKDVLQEANKIGNTNDLKTALSDILSLSKVLKNFKIYEPSIKETTIKFTQQIESEISNHFDVIQHLLNPIQKICEYKKEFEQVNDDGHKIQELREKVKKLLAEIPDFKSFYTKKDLICLINLWEEMYDQLDSYSSEDQSVPKDLKNLVKQAIHVFKEEDSFITQYSFSEAEKNDLIEIDNKRKASQMDESGIKKPKIETDEEELDASIGQEEGIDQGTLIAGQENMTNIGELKDLT